MDKGKEEDIYILIKLFPAHIGTIIVMVIAGARVCVLWPIFPAKFRIFVW